MSDQKYPIFTFVDDKKDGGMIVECGVCHGHFDLPNPFSFNPPVFNTEADCPHCDRKVYYPKYASW